MIELNNLHVRRIHWAIFSPSLLSYPYCAEYVRDEQHSSVIISLLQHLDEHPSEVDQHFLSLRHMPMGKYFEQLLFFILQRDERYEIILQNHQIVEEKTTVGEIDLIVRDTISNQLEHWEIALKFYLQSKPSSEQNMMLGPNAKDNLARKIKKLTEHQMTLSSHPQIEQLLKGQPIEKKLFIKGQFFYHLNSKTITPIDSNSNHESECWCFNSETDQMLDDNLEWTIIKKPDWIGGYEESNTSNLLSSSQIKKMLDEHFGRETQSVLCVGVQRTDKCCTEVSRCFVVNNHWPIQRV